MWWIDVLIVIFQICLALLFFAGKKHLDEFITRYYARDIAFESELGRTEAIGKAIDNVLKELEKMKSSVSLEEQRRHEMIKDRNKRLINLVRYSEEIRLFKLRLILAITNESKQDLSKILTSLCDVLVRLREDTYTLIAIFPEIKDESVTKFGDCLFSLGNEILTIVTNAISQQKTIEKYIDYAMKLDDGEEKVKWLKEANRIKNQFMELRNHKYEMIIGFAEIEQKYIVFLRHIFGNDMILQRNI